MNEGMRPAGSALTVSMEMGEVAGATVTEELTIGRTSRSEWERVGADANTGSVMSAVVGCV